MQVVALQLVSTLEKERAAILLGKGGVSARGWLGALGGAGPGKGALQGEEQCFKRDGSR